jgi:uncharacterized membrane protein
MATLTVWKFDNASGADDAVSTLERLAKEELIVIHDAATVSWAAGKKKPKTHQVSSMTGAGALGGAFWGMLFGLLFFIPLLGMAVGAAAGGAAGAMSDIGVDDSMMKSIGEQLEPGKAAVFALTSAGNLDKVLPELSRFNGQVLQTSLSSEGEQALREAVEQQRSGAAA